MLPKRFWNEKSYAPTGKSVRTSFIVAEKLAPAERGPTESGPYNLTITCLGTVYSSSENMERSLP